MVRPIRGSLTYLAVLTAVLQPGRARAAEPKPAVSFTQQRGRAMIAIDGRPVATYVYEDKKILRPYFAHVRTLGGIQVTRNHPPVAGKDPKDHATMHPGIWLAFGDLSGADFWRNKARVEHERFAARPTGGAGTGSFTVVNRYVSNGKLICRETCTHKVVVIRDGWLLICDSTFRSDEGDFTFADQEEMGLGVRVTTPITEKNGGVILNSDGRKTARGTWGRPADWCDYSGIVGPRRIGMTVMGAPDNFRRSWFNSRDYGLVVANPFGRKAMRKGDKSEIAVRKGRRFRIRFGVFVHGSDRRTAVDLKAAYAAFVKALDTGRRGE